MRFQPRRRPLSRARSMKVPMKSRNASRSGLRGKSALAKTAPWTKAAAAKMPGWLARKSAVRLASGVAGGGGGGSTVEGSIGSRVGLWGWVPPENRRGGGTRKPCIHGAREGWEVAVGSGVGGGTSAAGGAGSVGSGGRSAAGGAGSGVGEGRSAAGLEGMGSAGGSGCPAVASAASGSGRASAGGALSIGRSVGAGGGGGVDSLTGDGSDSKGEDGGITSAGARSAFSAMICTGAAGWDGSGSAGRAFCSAIAGSGAGSGSMETRGSGSGSNGGMWKR